MAALVGCAFGGAWRATAWRKEYEPSFRLEWLETITLSRLSVGHSQGLDRRCERIVLNEAVMRTV